MNKFLALIFLLAAFLPSTVNAVSDHVVINEFLPISTGGHGDWVELYNPTGTDANVSSWVLVDSTSVMKTISSGTTIPSHKFLPIGVNNRLDDAGDTITLKSSASSTEIIDTIFYPYEGLGIPGIDESMGRSPDGSDVWTIFFPSTPGNSNNPASPTPTTAPTETPTAIPSPTPSLEPTESPTPTPTEVPTPTVTNMPTSTPEPTDVPTPMPTILPTPSSTIHPNPTPINIQEIIEKRMICRFSYNRFKRLPNADYFINLLKSIFGPQSVCP